MKLKLELDATCKSSDWSLVQIRFDDGKFDSYTLTLEKESLKLDCYLLGSITGGTGTECGHTISGEKMTQFLRAAGVEDLAGLEKKANQLDSEGWRELHQQVMEYQTDSWSWSETNWDD